MTNRRVTHRRWIGPENWLVVTSRLASYLLFVFRHNLSRLPRFARGAKDGVPGKDIASLRVFRPGI